MAAMNTAWGAVALSLVLGFVLLLVGKFTTHTAIALVALVLIGMVLPALAWLIGGVVLLKVLLGNPSIFAGNLTGVSDKIRKAFTGA